MRIDLSVPPRRTPLLVALEIRFLNPTQGLLGLSKGRDMNVAMQFVERACHLRGHRTVFGLARLQNIGEICEWRTSYSESRSGQEWTHCLSEGCFDSYLRGILGGFK